MLIAILGRQPAISLAELESQFGAEKITPVSDSVALVDADSANVDNFGGILKFAQVELKFASKSTTDTLRQIAQFYRQSLPKNIGKITLGVSWYQQNISPRTAQLAGLKIKAAARSHKISLRLIPNHTAALSTATSHHNKLGQNPKKIELIITRYHNTVLVGRSLGVQNISAYRDRDQKRPKRDARVGMLPPKLAQILINLATGGDKPVQTVLDPFCGTGVVLQEAQLMGYQTIGSDKEPRMVEYSKANLDWLGQKFLDLEVGDATKHSWSNPADVIASEIYLGRPFSKLPMGPQITEESQIVTGILTGFLKNIQPQIKPGARLALAVPAWLRPNGEYVDLKLIHQPDILKELGFAKVVFKHISDDQLLYHRPDQIVARRLLVLERIN